MPIMDPMRTSRRRSQGGQVFRRIGGERGSVVSELTFGALCVGILVVGGLWVVAQLEGVSFQVLLQQIRNGS
jgi:hypothetical protein